MTFTYELNCEVRMKADLKSMTRRQLEKLRADVDKALARLADTEKKAALEAAQKAAKAHGFTLAQLTGAPAKKAAAAKPRKAKGGDGRAKVEPKYRNPANAADTWSGRGRAPKWMADHLAAGGSKDDYAI
jgi:DNA-binding protein H-NS